MKKYCSACSIEIPRTSKQWKKQIYCSTKCRKAAHRKKNSQRTREERKRSNMLQNDEVLYLVRQCRRAKTVQILNGHTSESFIETMKLVRERPRADVHLCHIAPVKGKNSIGLFHHKNLFYGGAYQNKKHGNKHTKAGLKIKKKELKEKWTVLEQHSVNDILLKIESYLGEALSEYIKKSPIRKSKRAQLAHKIIELKPKENFEDLMTKSHTELLTRWKKLSHSRTPIFTPHSRESKYIVYIDEICRFMSLSPSREKNLKELRNTMIIGYLALERVTQSQTYNEQFESKYGEIAAQYKMARLKSPQRWSEFKDLIYDTAFKALQKELGSPQAACKNILNHITFRPQKHVW